MIRSRVGLVFSLSTLALGAVQTGCESPDVEPLDDVSSTSEAPAARTGFIALTPISADRTPVLHHLAGELQATSAQSALDSLRSGAAERSDLLRRTGAVIADMDELGEADLAMYRSLVKAASEAGVPFVFENVRDSARMAAVFGYGVAGDVAIVEPSRGGTRFDIKLYGNIEATPVRSPSATIKVSHEAATLFPEELAARAPDRELAGQAAEGATPTPGPSREDVAAQVAARIRTLAAAPIVQPFALSVASAAPPGTYRQFIVNGSSWWTVPGTSQVATLDLSYEVELVASTTPNNKFMVITGVGAGANPGPLNTNSNFNRGYYQQQLNVSVVPGSTALSPYAHVPNSPNGQNSFTRSVGCSVGAQGGTDAASASFSCSFQDSATVSLSDFTAIDQSTGLTSAWSYRMTSAQGYPYWNPVDLVDQWTGTLHTLPFLAVSTLQPTYQTVYSAPSSFNGKVPLSVTHTQVLQGIYVDWNFFYVQAHPQGYSVSPKLDTTVDFGSVSSTNPAVTFTNQNSGLNMDVYYSETTPLSPIIQWPATGNPNQSFELIPTGDPDGSVFIKPKHSGLCFDIYYSSLEDGAELIQYTCTGNPNQKFVLRPVGAYRSIMNVNSQKCLSVEDASTAGYAQIVQEPCNTALPEQLFLPR
ncbi:RICIN domain-containing protein [Sorangium sp. So ce1504]|uniref:RICIN domain-containing protein n=1 Tax=Sorangium sp. So ce1504 TaxID=3133337 RepID=UPI003F6339BA